MNIANDGYGSVMSDTPASTPTPEPKPLPDTAPVVDDTDDGQTVPNPPHVDAPNEKGK